MADTRTYCNLKSIFPYKILKAGLNYILWNSHFTNGDKYDNTFTVNFFYYVRFPFLKAENMNMSAFWDIVLCSVVEVDDESRWWWRQYAPLKRRCTPRLNAAISHKALIFKSFIIWIFKAIHTCPGILRSGLRKPPLNKPLLCFVCK
jgi:hypothetical protein